MNDLVSVIIPIYNAEQYLLRCLNSLLAQTYNNLEIILINDGSSDKSKDICEELAKSNPNILFYSQENKGVCAARNLGLDIANGEFVCFVDADDFLPDDAISCLMNNMYSAQADCSIGNFQSVVESNPHPDKRNFTHNKIIWKDLDAIRNCLEDNPYTYSCWAKIYRRSLIEDTRFRVGRKIHEDSFFLFELFIKKPIIICQDICAYYYVYQPNSASHTVFSEKFFDILYFSDEKYKIIQEKHPELLPKMYNLQIKARMALLEKLCQNKGNKYVNFEKELIAFIKGKKQYFFPVSKSNKLWFFIIIHNMYFLYKAMSPLYLSIRRLLKTKLLQLLRK